MGILKSCISSSGNSVVLGHFSLYDEVTAIEVTPTNPGFDDVMREPYLNDQNLDRVGERVRPEIEVEVLGKADFSRFEEQTQDGTGNAPRSHVRFRVTRGELESRGLLVNGVVVIRPNDRLRRLEDRKGRIRYDFESGDRDGLYVFEVRPGETGSNVIDFLLETRRPVER